MPVPWTRCIQMHTPSPCGVCQRGGGVPSQFGGGECGCGKCCAPGFCVAALADTTRTVVACRALQAWRSLASGLLCLAGLCLFPILRVVVERGFREGAEGRGEGFRNCSAWSCLAGSALAWTCEELAPPPTRVHRFRGWFSCREIWRKPLDLAREIWQPNLKRQISHTKLTVTNPPPPPPAQPGNNRFGGDCP